MEKYPKIPQEVNLTISERGLLSLLADEVLDLSFLQGDEPMEMMKNEGDCERTPGLLTSPSRDEGD